MQATVTVKYVNQPKPGKQKGSIKTTDNAIYGVWPNLLPAFAAGQTYTIEYDEQIGQDGRKWTTVTRASPAAPQANGHANGAGKEVEIFITGVLGRCFQGTGQMPGQDQLTSMVRALRKAWAAGMKDLPSDPPVAAPVGPGIDDEIEY